MPRFYETTLSIINLHNLSISTHVNCSRIYCNTHERHLCFDHLILNIMLMKKLLLFLIGGILLIGTYGCANYEEDLLDEISPKQMLATVTTEIELADAVYHRDTVLDPAAE